VILLLYFRSLTVHLPLEAQIVKESTVIVKSQTGIEKTWIGAAKIQMENVKLLIAS
jgi:hypothetical protein